jgi:hypothetical protein
MAPLASVGEQRSAHVRERLARVIFQRGEQWYNFQGVRFYKQILQAEVRSGVGPALHGISRRVGVAAGHGLGQCIGRRRMGQRPASVTRDDASRRGGRRSITWPGVSVS